MTTLRQKIMSNGPLNGHGCIRLSCLKVISDLSSRDARVDARPRLVEPALAAGAGHLLEALVLVHAGLGVRQHLRVEVGCEYAHVPAAEARHRLLQRDRDRIRLLAGRAACRPDAQPPRRRHCASRARETPCRLRNSKWWPSRKNDVRLVVIAFVNSSSSAASPRAQQLDVVGELRQATAGAAGGRGGCRRVRASSPRARCRCARGPAGGSPRTRRRRAEIRARARRWAA